MKIGLVLTLTGWLVSGALMSTDVSARDRDQDNRRSSYSDEHGGGQHPFHRDINNSNSRDSYGQRDDVRGQGSYDRSDRDNRHDNRRWRDRDDERVYYRDDRRYDERRYDRYEQYPRRVIVEHPRYYHPRRVIYYVDDWGYRRGYYVSDSYYEHYYDSAYFRHGRHVHVGCHYDGFFDALAAGIVISAIVGDW